LRSRSAIYDRYLPLVLRWSLRETGNREVAADLVAETFAAAPIASLRYRPRKRSVGTWLLGIARNKLRESRRRPVGQPLIDLPIVSPDHLADLLWKMQHDSDTHELIYPAPGER
jgi:DNA-directed RNA polymerase specialized sigma24 family protein